MVLRACEGKSLMLGPKSKDSYPAEILTARKTEKYFGKDDIKIHYILHVDKVSCKDDNLR